MGASTESSSEFTWTQDDEAVMQKLADDDQVEGEWSRIRNMIKYMISMNVASFLADPLPSVPRVDGIPSTLSPDALTNGGLRLPPFPPRDPKPENLASPNRNNLSNTDMKGLEESIFNQLDEFDGTNPPFTIQRVSELCVNPRRHYRSVAKYLRAVEKSLLVTSTQDAFPRPPQGSASHGPLSTSDVTLRTATTPLFSPIPFLHEDARRSASRSPPASPLSLGRRHFTPDPTVIDVDPPSAVHALGLVDELDDPNPGHMSDHPQALTSVTSSGPIVVSGSLEDRFVKGSAQDGDGDMEVSRQEDDEVEDMILDDTDDDKENNP